MLSRKPRKTSNIQIYEKALKCGRPVPFRLNAESPCVAGATRGCRSYKVPRPDRRSSLGSLVFELQGRTEKRRLDKNGEENPKVKFIFVSVWNKGEDGRGMLKQYDISDQPNVTILADPGPRGIDHIKQFAGMPLSWIPTTWIYKGGDLRYALNYGEIRFPVLQQFLADSESEWEH